MSSCTSLYSNNSHNPENAFQNIMLIFRSNPSKFISDICKNLLKQNIEQTKESTLKHLRLIQTALDPTNFQIENPQEIIQQIKEIISCLEKDKLYTEKLWKKKEVQLNEGTLVFSDALKAILDDECFESLMRVMPEEYQERVTDCCFDGLFLQSKALETLLKYCPNISEEALYRIGAIWKEEDLSESIRMWPLFEKTSSKERPSIVTHSLQCLCKKKDDRSTQIGIINTITQIPFVDRENVVGLALKCFHDGIIGHEKNGILHIIAQMPSIDREAITAFALQYFYEGIPGSEKLWILKTIMAVPSEDREDAFTWSLQCFHKGTTGYEKSDILHAIAQIPPIDRKAVIELSLRYFPGDISADVLQAIATVPSEDREAVIVLAFKSLHAAASHSEKVGMLKTIAAIPLEDREYNIIWALQYFPEGISSEMLRSIIVIPFEDRKETIEWTLKCFYEGIAGAEKIKFLKIITAISPEKRENIVILALQYFQNEISSEIVRSIAAIPFESREDVITLCLQCFHERTSSNEKAEMLKVLTTIPFNDRENVIELILEYFEKGALSGICKAVAFIPFDDRADVIKLSLKCFHENTSNSEKIDVIKTIAAISPESRDSSIELILRYFPEKVSSRLLRAITAISSEDRENVLELASRCFHKGIYEIETIGMLKSIAAISPESREAVIDLAVQCFHSAISGTDKNWIIQAVTAISSEDRENAIELLLKYFSHGVTGYEKAEILRAIASVTMIDREKTIQLAITCFQHGNTHNEKANMIKAIAAIAHEDQENVIEWFLKCSLAKIDGANRLRLIEAISIIPKEERSFMDDAFMQDFLKSDYLNKDTLLNVYLLLSIIGSKEAVVDFIKDMNKHDQELITSLEQKLLDETLPQKTLIGLAQYADGRYGQKLLQEHPLMQCVIELLTINAVDGVKNPFALFGNLKRLRDIPIDFQVPIGETIPLRISMSRLKDMAIVSKIKREDLPEKATKEAWVSFIHALKAKVEMNAEEAKKAFNLLNTTWANIEGPLFQDPQNYLSRLFDLDGLVSDAEAKFKAIFNNVLSKNSIPRNGQFFTEQEEVFTTIMMVIQNCKGGKQEGIAAVYQLLDAAYKYRLQLSPPMTAEELLDLERKEEVIQFLRNFIQDTNAITEEALISRYKDDTRTNAGLFTALFGYSASSTYLLDEDDNDIYQLNEEGARVALSYIRDREKNNLIDYIAAVVRPVMERTISNDVFIQKLIEGNVSQGAHSSIYLKNSIGPFVGITNELIFDRSTGCLSDALLRKRREEILELFFTQVTPEILVLELIRIGVPALFMKLFLNEEQLTEEGARNLLEQTGYLEQ